MDEFEKIKAFSESLAERQKNIPTPETAKQDADLNFPEYLSQFRAIPVQEEKDSKRLLWFVLILGILIVALVIYALTQRFSSMEENEIVVISPTPLPVKVLPENPGGLNIPDRDKVVFNRDNVVADKRTVENLFPETEQPILPVEVIEPETKEVEVPVFELAETIPAPIDIPPSEPQEASPEVISEEIEVLHEKVSEAPQQASTELTSATEEVKVAVPAAPAAKPQVVWRAQLLSSARKAKVESSWKQISQKHKALLSDMPYQIVSATIPGKGTFWRLQVGEFATKEMVVNLCAKLKKKKQECIPVK